MGKKVFSVKDGNLIIKDDGIILMKNDYKPIASTHELCNFICYLLPSTLIRKQKSDEELAEEYINERIKNMGNAHLFNKTDCKKDFLAGRKSFGDKEFHLTIGDLERLIGAVGKSSLSSIEHWVSFITPHIYPHTIEVMHEGNNYLWETLNAIY